MRDGLSEGILKKFIVLLNLIYNRNIFEKGNKMFSINIGMFTSFLNTLAITTVFSISFVFTSLGAEELPPDQINNSNLRTSFIKTRDELNKKTIPITVASLTDRLLFHPPETVITLQQSYVRESFKKINFFQAVQRLYQSEGALGFYKGFFWPTASAIPTRYTVFGSYYAARRLLEDLPPYQRYLYSGVIAGLVKSIIQCPSEAERVRKVCNIKVENRLMPKNFFKGLFPLCLKHLFSVTPALGGSDVVFLHFNTVKEHPLGPFVTASSLSFMFQIIC
jgi:hypothetical protein